MQTLPFAFYPSAFVSTVLCESFTVSTGANSKHQLGQFGLEQTWKTLPAWWISKGYHELKGDFHLLISKTKQTSNDVKIKSLQNIIRKKKMLANLESRNSRPALKARTPRGRHKGGRNWVSPWQRRGKREQDGNKKRKRKVKTGLKKDV